MANLIGARVERKEDKKFLTGKGNYTADINLARQTYACFVRSPHARAKINKVDISKASSIIFRSNSFVSFICCYPQVVQLIHFQSFFQVLLLF